MPNPATTLRTCGKCGEEFEPRRMGRPRKFCPMCTPRTDEDRAAARAHWARVYSERESVRQAAAREQLRALRRRRRELAET